MSTGTGQQVATHVCETYAPTLLLRRSDGNRGGSFASRRADVFNDKDLRQLIDAVFARASLLMKVCAAGFLLRALTPQKS